jgi:hypothetical protein
MTEAHKTTMPLAFGSTEGLGRIRRVWQMPSGDTFDVPAMGALVRKHLRGVSVDPFARNKRWATHTNDLNPDTTAEHHMHAADFLSMLADRGVVADVVIFDPPYSPRQIAECYAAAGLTTDMQATQNAKLYADCRAAIRRLCKHGTVVLSFGWNSAGMGAGFALDELVLVCHGGAHNDTICMVEHMTERQEDLFHAP